jgi:hypothetical protein
MKDSKNKYPRGWNEARIRRVIRHYDSQSEEEAANEIERALIADANDPDAWEGPIRVTPRVAARPEAKSQTRKSKVRAYLKARRS